MNTKKLRVLCNSIYAEIDCAMNGLVWKDNQDAMESLSNAKELLGIIQESLEDEDADELCFEEW